jgi:hypothetical protein
MVEQSHYLCRVRLNGAVLFVVWYSGDRDDFVRDDDGRLRAASTPDALMAIPELQEIVQMNSEGSCHSQST